ncbi:hypothetical protein, partial [Bradyrhizobium japonicum]|uniref:hypothetical protein n=1 Tax=Bradyrhizobium japonicum TaxID=375 RepID=UPI001AEC4720
MFDILASRCTAFSTPKATIDRSVASANLQSASSRRHRGSTPVASFFRCPAGHFKFLRVWS